MPEARRAQITQFPVTTGLLASWMDAVHRKRFAGEHETQLGKNRSATPAPYLAIGSRRPGEETIHYPDDPVARFAVSG